MSPSMARKRRAILEKSENRRKVRILNHEMVTNTEYIIDSIYEYCIDNILLIIVYNRLRSYIIFFINRYIYIYLYIYFDLLPSTQLESLIK